MLSKCIFTAGLQCAFASLILPPNPPYIETRQPPRISGESVLESERPEFKPAFGPVHFGARSLQVTSNEINSKVHFIFPKVKEAGKCSVLMGSID